MKKKFSVNRQPEKKNIINFKDIKAEPEPKLKFKILKIDLILLSISWIIHIKKLLDNENWE